VFCGSSRRSNCERLVFNSTAIARFVFCCRAIFLLKLPSKHTFDRSALHLISISFLYEKVIEARSTVFVHRYDCHQRRTDNSGFGIVMDIR
jgi:hypothetical protein